MIYTSFDSMLSPIKKSSYSLSSQFIRPIEPSSNNELINETLSVTESLTDTEKQSLINEFIESIPIINSRNIAISEKIESITRKKILLLDMFDGYPKLEKVIPEISVVNDDEVIKWNTVQHAQYYDLLWHDLHNNQYGKYTNLSATSFPLNTLISNDNNESKLNIKVVAVNNGYHSDFSSNIQLLRGLPGQDGVKGEKGDSGEKGATGDQGPKGDTGEKGETGEQGPKGDTGEKEKQESKVLKVLRGKKEKQESKVLKAIRGKKEKQESKVLKVILEIKVLKVILEIKVLKVILEIKVLKVILEIKVLKVILVIQY